MTDFRKLTAAFTLVELAIVLSIAGLLIGGVIKGQELIRELQVTATISQVEAYRGAIMTFKKIYGDLPGDMNGEDRLPNCDDGCNPLGETFVGDGFVGNMTGAALWRFNTTGLGTSSSPNSENALFWLHLYKAGLIADVDNTLMIDHRAPFKFGVTHPAAAGGGGFIVKHPRTYTDQAGAPAAAEGIQGLVIGISKYPFAAEGATGGLDQTGKNHNMFSPLHARTIDEKSDDGYPAYGQTQAYGNTTSCFEGEGTPGGYKYWQKSTTKDCGLIFRIFR